MFNFKKILQLSMLLSLSSIAFATTAFSITPLTTQTTIQSNSEGAIRYTITNNATRSIPNLSVTPAWSSSGTNLSLANDNCTGQTLASGGSCTFDVSIPGANQPSSFEIRPKVCGFNGQLCSMPVNTTTVSIIQNTLPTRIYEVLFNAARDTEKLVGININDTSDILEAYITDNPSTDGPVAISPDGSKVYMTHQNADNTFSLLVFDVTSSSLTQSDTSYTLSYDGNNLKIPKQIAITPNGQTSFITDYSGTRAYPVYKIDLSSSNPSTAVSGITDTTGDLTGAQSIVISPDGQTVYVGNAAVSNDIYSFSVDSTTISTLDRTTNLSSLKVLLISSDDSTLYATGQLSSGGFPPAIEKLDITNNFNLDATYSGSGNGNIHSAALSPDNLKILAVANPGGQFTLYPITTSTMTLASDATTIPTGVVFPLSNFPYVAYAPDGSIAALTNYGNSGNLTALFNPSTPDDVSTVNPGGSGTTLYSYTFGRFIN